MPVNMPAIIRKPTIDTTHQEEDIAETCEYEIGEGRRAPIYRSAPNIVSVRWVLSQAEFDAFDEWFDDDMLAGSLSFNLPVQAQGGMFTEPIEALFLTPPECTYVAADIWDVSAAAVTVAVVFGAATTIFTSHLYPIESGANQLAIGGAIPVSGSLIVWPIESVQFGATYPVSGTLDVVLKSYTDQITESVQFGATYPVSGDLVTVLKTYTDQLTETVQFGATYPLSGTLETVLVTHIHQLTESVQFGATYPVSGTLV